MWLSWLLFFTMLSSVVAQEVPKHPPSYLAAAVSAAADEHAASARVLALDPVPVAGFSDDAAKPQRARPTPAATPSLPDTLPLPAVEASAAIAAAATAASAFADTVALDEHGIQGRAAQVPAPSAVQAVPSGCWQEGYTAEICCRDPPVANCWDAFFTRQRCCPDPRPTEPELSAEVAAVVAAAAARNANSASASSASSASNAKQSGREASWEAGGPASEAAGQQAFLRQEAQRRWPAYFSRAHETLNAAQGSYTAQPDPVQLYHLLYETINQVVGGLSLAADASRNSELKEAFLNAAILLARLAHASHGTPLEHEDFASQASAAAGLACRDKGKETHETHCNLAESLRRLEVSPDGMDWVQDALQQLNKSKGNSMENLQRFQRTWLTYSQDPAKALWRPAGAAACACNSRDFCITL